MADHIVVLSTRDFDLVQLESWCESLDPELPLKVDPRQAIFKSAGDVPSWATLLAEAGLWGKVLGGAAAIFAASFTAEAGKEAWKDRAKLASALAEKLGALRVLASKIVQLVSSRPEAKVNIGLPFPDEFFATTLNIETTSVETAAAEIALFVHYLPKVQQLLAVEFSATSPEVVGGIQLKLLEDGALEVSWVDRASLQKHSRRIDVG